MKAAFLKLAAYSGLVLIALSGSVNNGIAAEKYVSVSENTKIKINNSYYFSCSFSKTPSLGTTVLKIQVFDSSKKQVSPFVIFGESGMPSMPGHHDTGLIEFRLNKKNDYLLPVNVVMPGDWEVRIIIKKDSKEIFKGKISFDV
jgi:hypothetical protein